MPVRALLFDKDGTLVDIQATLGPATCDVLARLSGGDAALFGRLADIDACRYRRPAVVARLPGHQRGDRRLRPDVGARCWAVRSRTRSAPRSTGSICKPASTISIRSTIRVRCWAALRERGYPLGIMTNDAEANTRAQLRQLGIDGLIMFVAGYDSGFGMKPDAAPVLAFAASAGVAPSEVAVIGDSPHDLIAARAAGAVAVAVLSGPNRKSST